MRETEKRIRLYTERLPRVREKIYASLMLFAVAASMLAVATFSWITLSISPEVSGMPTTVAANGNLEIALVGKDAAVPEPSQVGDSVKDIQERNITWGNLVNLSDESYGLSQIILRPASLNTSDLLGKPLYAAQYTTDGRITSLNNEFRYTVYDSVVKTFVDADTTRGIRAISSVEATPVDAVDPSIQKYLDMLDAANLKVAATRATFNGLATAKREGKSTTYMDSIAGLIGSYLNDVFNDTNGAEIMKHDDVLGFYEFLIVLDEDVVTQLGEVLMTIMEIYQTNTASLTDAQGQPVNFTFEKFTSLDAFRAGAIAEWNRINQTRVAAGKEALEFVALTAYINAHKVLDEDITKLYNMLQPDSGIESSITWNKLQPIANNTINIKKVKIAGKTMDGWIAAVNDNMMVALDLLGMLNNSASQNEVVVVEGLLQSLDAILHNGVKGFTVNSITLRFDNAALQSFVKRYVGSGTAGSLATNMIKGKDKISGHIITNVIQDDAVQPISMINIDMATVEEVIAIPQVAMKVVAKETYGLALDFWLRTNKPYSYLLLEGDVETEGEDVIETVEYWETGKDAPTVLTNATIYLADITEKTTITYTDTSKAAETVENTRTAVEVFQVTAGSDVWYNKGTGQQIVTGTGESTEVTDDQGNVIGSQTITRSMTTPEKKQNEIIVGYSGANRIWMEKDLPEDYNKATSTTQGSGSCYTFYANTPEDMAQSLELVAALKVAFIDNSGKVLATASFDTEKYFAEYGRVTVPLYLDATSSKVEGEPDEKGQRPEIRYIQQMPKNEATLITAIIYLDGTMVSNDKVLSSSDIQGTLNIQFGAYTQPTAMKDETLMPEVREITASAAREDGQSGLEFEGREDENRNVIVTLKVTGSAPKTITANFIRKISETQGSAHTTFEFTDPEGDGTWTATVNMDRPGEFILRTVKVDGIEYRLPQEADQLPLVKVPGFSIGSLVSTGGHGELYTYRTANNYVTEGFKMTVYSGDTTKWPITVKGVFMGDDGSTLSIPFMRGANGEYTANATFSNSGTYTMAYVIMDDEYFQLDIPYIRHVYTGLYVKVSLKPLDEYNEVEEEMEMVGGGITYFYNGTPHEFDVSLEVFDSAHREMEELGNVMLYYGGGLSASLKWNAATGSYDGQQFLVDRPGSYTFDFVTISGETVNKASSAPFITCATKAPVQYLGITDALSPEVIAVRNGDEGLKFSMALKYGQAATVYGLFRKTMTPTGAAVALADDTTSAGEYYVVKAVNNNDDDGTGESTVTFSLPPTDGYWSLIDAKAETVFDGVTRTFYNGAPTDAKPEWASAAANTLTWISDIETDWHLADEKLNADGTTYEYDYYYNISDLKFEGEVTETKVIANLFMDYNLGYSSSGKYDTTAAELSFTGVFMQEHLLSNLSFSVTDFEGVSVASENAAPISFTLTKRQNSNFGGYTYANEYGDSDPSKQYTLTGTGENATSTVTGSIALTHARYYDVALNFDLKGTPISVGWQNGNANLNWKINSNESMVPRAVRVSSTIPTIAITAVTPGTSTPGTTSSYTAVVEKASGSATSTWNATSATLYAKGSYTPASDCEGEKYTCEEKPTVIFTLTGIGNATQAAMPFTASSGSNLYIYESDFSHAWNGNDTPAVSQCVWKADSGKKLWIGKYDVSGVTAIDPAGTITANKLVLTHGGIEYTVNIPAITINNPKSLP